MTSDQNGLTRHDRPLRDHYGIDRGDQELRSDNKSYATRVPEDGGTAERVEDVDSLDTPDADKRTEETESRLHDPGSAEMRHVDAGAIADENAKRSGKEDTGSRADEGAKSSSEEEANSSSGDGTERQGEEGTEG